ncbi:hypothetical protein J6590_024083 [Homalodisca vitripennis]|nr:hypothetical protein J6590_024083 [Homalodisca vitripennis]
MTIVCGRNKQDPEVGGLPALLVSVFSSVHAATGSALSDTQPLVGSSCRTAAGTSKDPEVGGLPALLVSVFPSVHAATGSALSDTQPLVGSSCRTAAGTSRILRWVGYRHCLSLCFLAYTLRLGLLSLIHNPWWALAVELLQEQVKQDQVGGLPALLISVFLAYTRLGLLSVHNPWWALAVELLQEQVKQDPEVGGLPALLISVFPGVQLRLGLLSLIHNPWWALAVELLQEQSMTVAGSWWVGYRHCLSLCFLAYTLRLGLLSLIHNPGRILRWVGYRHCLSLCFLAYTLRLGLLSVIHNPWWALAVELLQEQVKQDPEVGGLPALLVSVFPSVHAATGSALSDTQPLVGSSCRTAAGTSRILRWVGYRHCLSLCFLAYTLRLGLLSLIHNPWWALAVELLQGPSYALSYTTIVAYAAAVSPPGTSATVQGVAAGVDDGLGYSVGSLMGGLLYRSLGGGLAFRVFSMFALACSISHWLLYVLFFRESTTGDQQSREKRNIYNPPKEASEMVVVAS